MIGKGSWHVVEGLDSAQMKQQNVVEGEYISKEKRIDQVNYLRSAHFKIGKEEEGFNS